MRPNRAGAGKARASLAVLVTLQTLATLSLLHYTLVREPGALFVTILFAMPLLLQIAGLLILTDKSLTTFYSALSFFFTGSYFAGWLIYIFVQRPPSCASGIFLAISFLLVLLASMTTGLLFYRDNGARGHRSWQSRIAASLGTSPAAEILLALSFFMSVAYVIAFAFALEDRYEVAHGGLPGLVRVSPSGSSPLPMVRSSGRTGRSSSWDDLPKKRWEIQFKLGSAALAIDRPLNGNASSEAEELSALKNRMILDQLIEVLSREWRRQAVRVTLTGYASQIPISPRFRSQYGSNYELAEARIRAVQIYLTETLTTEREIEWLLVPVTEDEEARPRVEVVVQPIKSVGSKETLREFRPLILIEYLYFTVYTVTTTGYGDIIPGSSFAMFTCTIANWYEVFFLAIFFNVLLSAKRQPDKDGNHGSDIRPPQ